MEAALLQERLAEARRRALQFAQRAAQANADIRVTLASLSILRRQTDDEYERLSRQPSSSRALVDDMEVQDAAEFVVELQRRLRAAKDIHRQKIKSLAELQRSLPPARPQNAKTMTTEEEAEMVARFEAKGVCLRERRAAAADVSLRQCIANASAGSAKLSREEQAAVVARFERYGRDKDTRLQKEREERVAALSSPRQRLSQSEQASVVRRFDGYAARLRANTATAAQQQPGCGSSSSPRGTNANRHARNRNRSSEEVTRALREGVRES